MSKIWIEQCDAAGNIEDEYGTPQALESLVGDKFVNFLEAADEHVIQQCTPELLLMQ